MATAEARFQGAPGTLPALSTGLYGPTIVVVDNGGTFRLSADRSISGSCSGCANSETLNGNYSWMDINTGVDVYSRQYFYLTAAPTVDIGLAASWDTAHPETLSVGVTPDLRLFSTFRSTGTQSQTGAQHTRSTAGMVPLNEWFRLEVHIRHQYGLSTNLIEVKLWKASGAGVHSAATPDYTSLTGVAAVAGHPWAIFYGYVAIQPFGVQADYLALPAGEHLYMDEFAWSTSTWVGPATVHPPPSATSFEGAYNSNPPAPSASPAFNGGTPLAPIQLPNPGDFLLSTDNRYSGLSSGRTGSSTVNGNHTYPAPATTFYRAYYYLTAPPKVGDPLGLAAVWDLSFANSHAVGVDSNLALYANVNGTGTRRGVGVANTATADGVVPVGKWFRLEARFTVDSVEARIWITDPQSNGTPDITLTPGASTLGNGIGTLFLGHVSIDTAGAGFYTALASGQALFTDEWAVSTETWIGPTANAPVGKSGRSLGRF